MHFCQETTALGDIAKLSTGFLAFSDVVSNKLLPTSSAISALGTKTARLNPSQYL